MLFPALCEELKSTRLVLTTMLFLITLAGVVALVYLLFEVAALRRRVDQLESLIGQQASHSAESLSPPLKPVYAPETEEWAGEPELEEWVDDGAVSPAVPVSASAMMAQPPAEAKAAGLDGAAGPEQQPFFASKELLAALSGDTAVTEPESAKAAAPPISNAAEPPKTADPIKIAEPQGAHTAPEPPATPQLSAFEKLAGAAFIAAKNWLLGGNTAVRIGLLVLFMGLAWLLRYASERYAPPVEFRYIGVAAAALVLLILGWMLRWKRPSFALLLQGGGIAVLYLTTFAALRLHALIPPQGAFAVMLSLTAAAVALALMQDAMGLACAAALGGFASPILISTGGGNHVALFSYFALLNTGIALIAWFKAWRVLNLIGFVGTFSIVGAFSIIGKFGLGADLDSLARYYTPDKFLSTEPFLILFLLMFVLIGLFFARRKLMAQPETNGKFSISPWSETGADYLDGTLAFGPPLVGFGLQCLIISHIEYGMAFSALALGLFYMALAYCLRGRPAIRMMTQVYLALGVVFGTLAIPLAFDARWTSAAWALEGAGVYWVGHMRRRSLAKVFALLLILVASILYLREFSYNYDTPEPLLLGSPMGAALLGLSCLVCFYIRRSATDVVHKELEQFVSSALAIAGLAFLYLIAPLVFGRDGVVIAWALAGVATLFAGARLGSRVLIVSSFAIQAFGGALFLASLRIGQDFSLLTGWMGVLRAGLIGAALTASALFLARGNIRQDEAPPKALMTIPVWAGLFFINLAFLFVLNWGQVGMAWAASGLLILWLGLWSRIPALFYFGIVLEAAAGLAFLSNRLAQFTPSNGWAAAALALAALIGAWRLHRAASHADPNQQSPRPSLDPLPMGVLANLLLVWGVGWWVWCVADRVMFYLGTDSGVGLEFFHWVLLVLSVSAALWMALARILKWPSLAHASLLPLAVAAFVLARYGVTLHWLVAVAWVAFFLVHLLTLRLLSNLLFEKVQRIAHVLGVWLGILVLMLTTIEIFNHFMPDERGSAWYWLAWVFVPSLYLWWAARDKARSWPVAAFRREYRLYAAFPVMAAMMIWLWSANLISSGVCAPLPYIPLFNPLELGLLLVLFACWRWSLFWAPEAGESWKFLRQAIAITACVSIVAIATLAVCRFAHAWAGVPFDPYSMAHSMGVQTGWSIVWALVALVLMIGGSIRKNRFVWQAGAVLAGVVVLKLFFVELRGHGGLARIISFIAVGALGVIVGYFAPMPPKKPEEPEQKQTIT